MRTLAGITVQLFSVGIAWFGDHMQDLFRTTHRGSDFQHSDQEKPYLVRKAYNLSISTRTWNPLSDPAAGKAKGYALISAASVSAQIANLGASETLFWGEII